jgi:16S rRNA (guanine527-N7)-methyltransferase
MKMIEKTPLLPDFSEIWQTTLGWKPTLFQQQQFHRLYDEILWGNRQFNLTRITEPEEFWEKHLWDSLAGLIELNFTAEIEKQQKLQVIDIGTGAGFPGVPIAIALENWQITLLDSTRKKVRFLQHLISQLRLKNAQTLTRRVEEIAQESAHRQVYDLALIRAVGSVSVCAEYALPLVKLGGKAILYRGHWTEEEQFSLESSVQQLGGKIGSIQSFTTPLTQSIRHCIYLEKISPTSTQFPRAVGIPTQQPLS